MSMDTQRSGQWYIPGSADANAQHTSTFALTRDFNARGNTDPSRAGELLSQMFSPASATSEIWAPLHLEYGVNTTFGKGCFLNFNCVILDIAPINIGPGCQLITVEHPLENVQQRAEGWERGRPITIGANCWFGAGAIVLPRAIIGDN